MVVAIVRSAVSCGARMLTSSRCVSGTKLGGAITREPGNTDVAPPNDGGAGCATWQAASEHGAITEIRRRMWR